MSEWKTYKYTDIATIVGGGTPKTTEVAYWNGKIPWISIKDLVGTIKYVYSTEKYITELGLTKSSAKLLHEGDIVISARGTIGEIAILSCPMSFNQSCFGICANENIVDGTFLYYLTKTKINALKAVSYGSVFDTITSSTFENLEISLPPLPEQKRIAGILSALDDKIELNRRINANLEAQAQLLFDKMVVDGCAGAQKLSLLDIANYTNGLAMQKFRPEANEEGMPVLKIKELGQGKCDSSSDVCCAAIGEEFIVNDGDIIFSWSGTLLVDIWCGGKCGLNQHLFKVTSDSYPKWFVYFWTKHHLANFIRIAKDKAVTMGHIKRCDLAASEVYIPNEEDLARIDVLIGPILNQIISNRVENKHLSTLRDTLLPKLMKETFVL